MVEYVRHKLTLNYGRLYALIIGTLLSCSSIDIEYGFAAHGSSEIDHASTRSIKEVTPALIQDAAEMSCSDVTLSLARLWIFGRGQRQVCAQRIKFCAASRVVIAVDRELGGACRSVVFPDHQVGLLGCQQLPSRQEDIAHILLATGTDLFDDCAAQDARAQMVSRFRITRFVRLGIDFFSHR